MARKSSDLLDVFRHRPQGAGGGAAASKRRKSAKAKGRQRPAREGKASPARPRRRTKQDEVVSLTRRQLLYAGCVVLLLVALSFTLGISLGGGGETAPAPALSRPSAPFWIAGAIPKNAVLADKKIDIVKAARSLYHQFGVARDRLRIFNQKDRYELRIGPFQDRGEAFSYYHNYSLSGFNYAGQAPLFPPRWVQERLPPPK